MMGRDNVCWLLAAQDSHINTDRETIRPVYRRGRAEAIGTPRWPISHVSPLKARHSRGIGQLVTEAGIQSVT